jgi:hypothetical protein
MGKLVSTGGVVLFQDSHWERRSILGMGSGGYIFSYMRNLARPAMHLLANSEFEPTRGMICPIDFV